MTSWETVVVNADIRTMDLANPRAEAISFSDGRILYVGNESRVLAKTGRNLRIIDAQGRAVLPGFIDCHTHFISLGVWSRRLDLSAARSLSEVLEAVKRRAGRLNAGSVTARGGWVLGRGWDEARWPGGRYLDRRELDSAAPDNPVMLIRVCGHMASLNTKGIARLSGIIGHKGVDRSNGIITEGALGLARSHLRPSAGELEAGLEHSLRKAKRLGVTSVHDIVDIPKLRAYERARCANRLTVRSCLHFERGDFESILRMGVRSGWSRPLIRVGGMKLYADGSFGARTAALSAPYADAPREKGALLHPASRLRTLVQNAEKRGIQLLIHAIGDRAVEQAVSAFSSSLKRPSRLRHRIEHLELPQRSELAQMRKLGLIASMQPNFVGEWGHPGGMMEARLGKRRYRQADPFKRVLQANVPLIFGSDCMPLDPLYGIHSAVNAPFPAQRLTVTEAVAAYTSTAASASFEEGFKGTLSPGKAADLVFLSADPFKAPSRIKEIRVDTTIFDGNLVWNGP